MTLQHGTRAAYSTHGCRCAECRAAHARYETQRTRRIAYGTWQPYVDARPVREHLERLRAAGLGRRQVARLAGVSVGAIEKQLYGGPGARPAPDRMRAETARRLLAVRATPDTLAEGARTDTAGTRRRAEALATLGWSISAQAALLGLQPANYHAVLKRPRIRPRTARAVADLYDRLWNTPPPEDTPARQRAVSRTRRRAAAAGWAPPAAWDDDLIDLPDEQLHAELDRRVAAMTNSELQACHKAHYHQGDPSPLIAAGARAYSRANHARGRARKRRHLQEASR